MTQQYVLGEFIPQKYLHSLINLYRTVHSNFTVIAKKKKWKEPKCPPVGKWLNNGHSSISWNQLVTTTTQDHF